MKTNFKQFFKATEKGISKKLLPFIVACATTVAATAQVPATQWQKTMGGNGTDDAYSIIQTTDGGYALIGSSDETSGEVTGNHGGSDYWVTKRNSAGAIEWQKSLGGEGEDLAYSIAQTADGGFVIAGNSDSQTGDVTGNQGYSDYWIVKLSSTGTLEWQKSLGGSGVDQAYSVIQTVDGGYAVAGLSRSNDGDVIAAHGENDCWMVKLSSAGLIEWQKSLGGSDVDEGYSVIQAADGGYVIAGTTSSTDGDVTGHHGINWNVDAWVIKLSDLGVIEWQKAFGGSNYDNAASIIETADGGYAMAGQSSSTDGDVTVNHGARDFWAVKMDRTGILEWQKSIGGSTGDESSSIVQCTDGGYMIAGYSNYNDGDVTGNHGLYDFLVVKLRPLGAVEYTKTYGGSSNDLGNSIVKTTDGGFALAGRSYSLDGDVAGHNGAAGTSDFWMIKLEAPAAAGVEETKNVVANMDVYPNPTSGKLFIDANGSTIDQVNIYTTNGSLVSQINKVQNRTVDMSQMPNGVYVAEIIAGNTNMKKRLVKM